MSIRLSAVLSLILLAVIPYAKAQRIDWDTKDLQVVSQPIGSLSVQDQKGIASRLGVKPEDLLAMRVETASGHIFLVQGVYRIGGICGANNCSFLVLSSDYKVLLSKVAQMYKLQSTTHHGLPDIITTMHGSATDSGLSYWQFQGTRYMRIACADALYGDADGNEYKIPHITPHPCRTGG
jgi:hypothetical protein